MSKLGVGQFDEDDLRLLEVLAGHASVALENARLYESAAPRGRERDAPGSSSPTLVSEARSVEEIGERDRFDGRPRDGGRAGSLWIEDAHAANFRCVASLGYDDDPSAAAVPGLRIGRATAAR